MFKTKFEVIEIRKSGAIITHYLNGKRSEVKKDVEAFKDVAERYQMVGKKAVIVWM